MQKVKLQFVCAIYICPYPFPVSFLKRKPICDAVLIYTTISMIQLSLLASLANKSYLAMAESKHKAQGNYKTSYLYSFYL